MNAKGKSDDPINEQIISAAYKVMNTLGVGFLEKVYENALAIELRKRGLYVQQQVPLTVYYENEEVGKYVADLLVENKIIVELKNVDSIIKVHVKQCINYLRATGLKTCLLINFGNSTVEVKRVVN